MYGHLTSHNSYNSPLIVNSFKWGNKIVATFDYSKGSETYKVDTYAENMTKKFHDMIALHIWMTKNRLLTLSHRALPAIAKVLKEFKVGKEYQLALVHFACR